MSVVVERDFFLANQGGPRGGCRRTVNAGVEPPPAPAGRVPRISKLMALAIRCDQMLRSGAVPDASTLARLARVTQPRMTQILNLTLLAPDIQEKLLFLAPVEDGKPEISEKGMRMACGVIRWERQRRMIELPLAEGCSENRFLQTHMRVVGFHFVNGVVEEK